MLQRSRRLLCAAHRHRATVTQLKNDQPWIQRPVSCLAVTPTRWHVVALVASDANDRSRKSGRDLANPLNLTTPRVYHRCGQARRQSRSGCAHLSRHRASTGSGITRGGGHAERAEASDAMDRDVNRLIPAVRSVPGHPYTGKPATVSRTPLCVPCAGHRRIRPRHRGSSSTWGGALSCPELPGC
jgi:hypothetical protein